MALVNCPECKKEVSNTANTCPNFGYQLKKQIVNLNVDRSHYLYEKEHDRKYKSMIVAGIISLILGPCFLLFLANCTNRSSSQLLGMIIGFSIVFVLVSLFLIIFGFKRLCE